MRAGLQPIGLFEPSPIRTAFDRARRSVLAIIRRPNWRRVIWDACRAEEVPIFRGAGRLGFAMF